MMDSDLDADSVAVAPEIAASLVAGARPRFITFEGIDGAGKSSHIEAVAGMVRARGVEVVVTR